MGLCNSHVEQTADEQRELWPNDGDHRHTNPVPNGNHQIDDAKATERDVHVHTYI